MKLNLVVKTTKNYQSIEISATDIEPGKYPETKAWLIKEAQIAINQLEPGENTTQGAPRKNNNNNTKTYSTNNYRAPAMASDKQIKLLQELGYCGDLNISKDEASALIDQYFNNKR